MTYEELLEWIEKGKEIAATGDAEIVHQVCDEIVYAVLRWITTANRDDYIYESVACAALEVVDSAKVPMSDWWCN